MTSTRDDHESDARIGGDATVASEVTEGDFIDETVTYWQKQTSRELTREDGREIIENMTGFFRILLEWDRAEQAATRKDEEPSR